MDTTQLLIIALVWIVIGVLVVYMLIQRYRKAKNEGQVKTPEAPVEELLDENEFWNLIDLCHLKSKGNYRRQQNLLISELKKLQPEGIMLFDNTFQSIMDVADVPAVKNRFEELYPGQPRTIYNGFRAWLIGRGYDEFRKMLTNPDLITKTEAPEDLSGLELCGAAAIQEITS